MSQPEPLSVRAFGEADALVIEPWLTGPGLSLPPGMPRAVWARRMMVDRGILARVGVLGASVVGFVRLDCGPDHVAEVTLVVAPGFRRRGIGSRMLAGIVEEGRRRGIRRVQAMVDPGNSDALQFFAEHAFEQDGGDVAGTRVRLVRLVHAEDHREPLEIEV